MNNIARIPFYELTPPNGAASMDKFAKLLVSMARDGWQGRPLLGVEHGAGVRLLTGSHRLEAWRYIEEKVPVYVIRGDAAATIHRKHWALVTEDAGAMLEVLETLDPEAAKLLKLEAVPWPAQSLQPTP